MSQHNISGSIVKEGQENRCWSWLISNKIRSLWILFSLLNGSSSLSFSPLHRQHVRPSPMVGHPFLVVQPPRLRLHKSQLILAAVPKSSSNQPKSTKKSFQQAAAAAAAAASPPKQKTFSHSSSPKSVSKMAVNHSEKSLKSQSYAQQSLTPHTNQTLGQIIQEFSDFSSPPLLLSLTRSHIWLPTDANLPSHLKQRIHHDKRRRWASLLLDKLGCECNFGNVSSSSNTMCMDETLCRVILAAAIPYSSSSSSNSTHQKKEELEQQNEMTIVHSSLMGIHALIGKTFIPNKNHGSASFHPQILHGIVLFIQQAEDLAYQWTLQQAVEVRWAIRGILTRILESNTVDGKSLVDMIVKYKKQQPLTDESLDPYLIKQENKRGFLLAQCIPQLERRVSQLPFDILPCGINWQSITQESISTHQHSHGSKNRNDDNVSSSSNPLHQLQNQIDFRFENIITLSGNSVLERRGTAWVTEKGIGSLAYSGKLMEPKTLPPMVITTMRHVEEAMFQNFHRYQDDDDDDDSSFSAGKLCWEETGQFFDCALCNLYPTGQSACKFHTDPEHGTYWDRLTCVVSAGEERKFSFRPIPGKNVWSQWDVVIADNTVENQSKGQGTHRKGVNLDEEWNPTWNSDKEFMPAWIHLFPGDIVQMMGPCNDLFHHSVYPASTCTDGSVRVSLVLKRALDRNGRRGHGKAL